MLRGLFNLLGTKVPPAEPYTPPTSTHQQIVNDLVSYGATEAEAIRIVAKSATRNWATRNWASATGNHTRGDLREAELNEINGGGRS